MSAKLTLPFNLDGWIDQNLPRALGAISHQGSVQELRLSIPQIIKGPNARNDFHIDPFDEIFYQLKGHIFLHVIEDGQERRLRIEEGDVFILPKQIFFIHPDGRPARSAWSWSARASRTNSTASPGSVRPAAPASTRSNFGATTSSAG